MAFKIVPLIIMLQSFYVFIVGLRSGRQMKVIFLAALSQAAFSVVPLCVTTHFVCEWRCVKHSDIFEWTLYQRRHRNIEITAGFMELRNLAIPHALEDKMATR